MRAVAPWAGLAWGHLSLASVGWVAQLGEPVLESLAARVLGWTLLLPLSVSGALAHATTHPLEAVIVAGLPAVALPAPAIAGCAIATAACLMAGEGRVRRAARAGVFAAVVVTIFASVSLADTVITERAADRLFLKMTEGDAPPWERPGGRSAARRIVTEYPGSKWASEAWRVVAIEAELEGRHTDAVNAWHAYGECFGAQPLPGGAVAALSIARLLEDTAPPGVVAHHYQDAFRTLRRAGPENQEWLALESARSLERIFRTRGLVATAERWAARAYTDRTETKTESEGNDDEGI